MRSCLLPLLLLLAAASVSDTICPDHWTPYEDKCYRFSDFTNVWINAESNCELAHPGATLASVHNIAQNTFLAENVTGGTLAWLGFHRVNATASWEWVDGSSSDYRYWYNNQPDPVAEQCALINCGNEGTNTTDQTWCSFPCGLGFHSHWFICQVDAE